MNEYLRASEIIDWPNSAILQMAKHLADNLQTPEAIAKACFEWVRDHIHHSSDYQLNPVTSCASDVLKHRTGYCFAKSHLLAALLRANTIPAGFCYQRLRLNENEDDTPYTLHGFNAIYLPQWGWYRVDARGNRAGVDAQFCPPREQLAYQAQFPGEADLPTIFAEPLPVVVEALQTYDTWDQLLNHLPDIPLN